MRTIVWFFAPVIGWIFTHMSFAIPVNRLRETDTLLAFYHPKPIYPFHVILVPKRPVPTLKDLDPNDAAFLRDLYSTVQNLVDEFHLTAYRLIVNGGEFQDFPHLHFHLISPLAPTPTPPPTLGEGQGERGNNL
ncbi:MAG: HIT domain-containing protein [Chloroflexota bacterium]